MYYNLGAGDSRLRDARPSLCIINTVLSNRLKPSENELYKFGVNTGSLHATRRGSTPKRVEDTTLTRTRATFAGL